MVTQKWAHAALWLGVCLASVDARASCYAFVAPPGEPVTNADSSIVVVFDGEQTHVTMASDTQGESASFGYVLPVPKGFTVAEATLVDPLVYDGLQDWVAPRLVQATCAAPPPSNGLLASGCSGPMGLSIGGPPLGELPAIDSIVTEHRTLGAYDLTVLEPDGERELSGWLEENGFQLPEGAEPLVEDLVDEGVWFLAVHVDGTSGEGWVEPMRLTYEGRMNTVPLALGATSSDGVQDLVVLVVDGTGDGARISNYREVELESDCMIESDLATTYEGALDVALLDGVQGRAAWVQETVHTLGAGELDPTWLEAVGSSSDVAGTTLTRLHLRYTPEQIDEDLVLLSNEDPDEHSTNYLAHATELESSYPMCDSGYVLLNPGTCPSTGATSSGGCASAPGGAPWIGLWILVIAHRRRRPPAAADGP